MDTLEPTACTWMIRGVPRWVTEAFAEDPDFDWYPDSPSDLISECGAEVVQYPNGWECAAGHSHFDDREYFDEDEIGRTSLPANAADASTGHLLFGGN